MIIFNSIKNIIISDPTVVVIGKFDGVHLGHQKLIKTACRVRDGLKGGAKTCVVLLKENGPVPPILSEEDRETKLRMCGANYVVNCELNDELRRVSAKEYLSEVLIKKLGAKAIVAGPDVSFGCMGAGNAQFLKEKEEEYGYRFVLIEKETYKGSEISSSRIRECLLRGEKEDAEIMLGMRKKISH